MFTLMAAAGCRSDKGNGVRDAVEHDVVPLRVGDEQEGDVPGYLWSPSRRKASASFFYLVGEYKVLAGEIRGAQDLFESAYNLDPNPFVGAKLIAAEAATGRTEESLVNARKMMLLYPKSG